MIKNTLITLIIIVQMLGLGLFAYYLVEETERRFYYERAYYGVLNFTEEMHRTVWGKVDPAHRCIKR